MQTKHWIALASAAAIGVGCASMAPGPTDAELRAKAVEVMKASFKDRGQAKVDRLTQDETQALCSQYAGKELPKDVATKIEQANLSAVKYPANGQYVGDWKRGEQIAQRGTGFQFSDDPAQPSGANCYACHQLSKQEISFGTIGPSLYNFAKLRGYGDDMKKYAWGKVWNAEAYSACTNMPRFGHTGILTEEQVRDVVALLMDPASPVNQ
ncbi:MAG TPA: sulfur oxidation c-type cytochrome SoxX [Casimicrobiaceae bacterium]|jgi:sulfur-oxidizing protein SoxX